MLYTGNAHLNWRVWTLGSFLWSRWWRCESSSETCPWQEWSAWLVSRKRLKYRDCGENALKKIIFINISYYSQSVAKPPRPGGINQLSTLGDGSRPWHPPSGCPLFLFFSPSLNLWRTVALHHDKHLTTCSHKYPTAGRRARAKHIHGQQQRQPVTCRVCNRSTSKVGSPAPCQRGGLWFLSW